MNSRADQHDMDKLARWQEDLTGAATVAFPVYAIFLVSEADKAAHNVFRGFRNSFEARNAGFGNLVIFGQHGLSRTVHAMLDRLGLSYDLVPLVLLLVSRNDSRALVLPLSSGESESGADSPAKLLSRVEEFLDQSVDRSSVDRLKETFDDSGVIGLKPVRLPEAGLAVLVDQLVEEVK